jgi:hypothetical protein
MLSHQIVVEDLDVPESDAAKRQSVAVFITLSSNPDLTAFQRLLRENPGKFAAAIGVTVQPQTDLLPSEAGAFAKAVADAVKSFAAAAGRADIHLAYQGPYAMAVLIGRLLNTYRAVVYEWDNSSTEGVRYCEMLTLVPGVAAGPITAVAPPVEGWN